MLHGRKCFLNVGTLVHAAVSTNKKGKPSATTNINIDFRQGIRPEDRAPGLADKPAATDIKY